MGNFGDPTFVSEEVATQDNGLNTVQDTIDINDPALVSEALDVNLEGDAYAFPPPPPAGIYRAKLKLLQVENSAKQKVDWLPARWGKQTPQTVAVVQIEASMIDPSGKYEGIRVFDRNVSTFLGRDKSSKMQTILTRLKRPDGTAWIRAGERLTPRDWAERFVSALAGEPEVGIEIDWEWSCQGCAKHAKETKTDYPRRLVGMARCFPPEQDPGKRRAGNLFSPELRCQTVPAHGFSRCQLVISRVLSLAELAAIKGPGQAAGSGQIGSRSHKYMYDGRKQASSVEWASTLRETGPRVPWPPSARRG